MGDIIVSGINKPTREYITCLPSSMMTFSGISNGILWNSMNDMGKKCYCWAAGNFDTFHATNEYNSTMPELQNVYNIEPKILSDYTVSNSAPSSKQVVNGILI